MAKKKNEKPEALSVFETEPIVNNNNINVSIVSKLNNNKVEEPIVKPFMWDFAGYDMQAQDIKTIYTKDFPSITYKNKNIVILVFDNPIQKLEINETVLGNEISISYAKRFEQNSLMIDMTKGFFLKQTEEIDWISNTENDIKNKINEEKLRIYSEAEQNGKFVQSNPRNNQQTQYSNKEEFLRKNPHLLNDLL